jgi:DNA-binding NarL/FixJ family response regulator
MSKPVRILIVDDHPPLRAGLAAMLTPHKQFAVVGEAGDAVGAVAACKQCAPDVVLMDLRIPGGGVEATLAIRQRWPSIRVIVITTYDGDEDIYRAMQAGACGYLLKGLTSSELANAIAIAASGGRVMPPNVAARYLGRTMRKDLSPRELEVLRLIVAGHSNKEIAEVLSIGEESVKSHLKSIFLKLSVVDRTQAAIEAIRQGIIHLGD